MSRIDEPGWTRVTPLDRAGRRAIWYRLTADGVELCAGREGEDEHVRLVVGEELTPRQHDALVGLLRAEAWATETDEDRNDRAEAR